MKENIKIALLAVIAGTLIFNTVSNFSGNASETSLMADNSASSAVNAMPVSNTGHEGHNHAAEKPAERPAEKPAFTGPLTSVKFEKSAHDFGTIKQETKNNYKFKFKNTGSSPLIIENAQGSCGCTVPEYPKEPIAPGASAFITVEYSPGKQQGANTKTVTITANTEPRETVLTISANVEEVK
jgi:hypothetical protein